MVRTQEKWDSQYKLANYLLKMSKEYEGDNYMLEEYAKALRNPIVFDNQVADATSILEYKIPNPNNEDETLDHLVGISNIVLYMIKNKTYEKWNSLDDFKKSLQAMQVVIKCPRSYNNKMTWKNGWMFGFLEAETSIQWNRKLEQHGITHLIDKLGNLVPVGVVWSEWFSKNRMHL